MQEGVYDPGILKAVFLAGGPGSGKTTVINQLFGVAFNSFSYAGLKPVNSDKFFEYLLKAKGISSDLTSLDPEKLKTVNVGPQSLRMKAKELTAANYLNYLNGRLGVLIDGTGGDPTMIIKQAEDLKSTFGYDVSMVFVNTPLETALARNNTRARKLPQEVVTSSWNAAQQALSEYKTYFKKDFVVVVNDKQVERGQALDIDPQITKMVDTFIKQSISNPIGKEWIKQSLAAKNVSEVVNSPYKIYCDMDGVLCDFLKQWEIFYGESAADAKKRDRDKFGDTLNSTSFEFWATMKWMPGSKRMWDVISKYGVTILSSPADTPDCIAGKKAWIQKNMPGTPSVFEKSYNKQKYAAPDAILIDDYKRNIDQWQAKGGIDILYINANQVINNLAEWDIK